jgi:uncharacterized membrane protein YfcA
LLGLFRNLQGSLFAAAAAERPPRFLNANASAFCSVKSPTPKKETFSLGILGTFSGCIGPLVGVGGGIISIPIWREFTTLPQKMLSATSHCGSVDIYY